MEQLGTHQGHSQVRECRCPTNLLALHRYLAAVGSHSPAPARRRPPRRYSRAIRPSARPPRVVPRSARP
eukprot:6172813-Pleurochrysis_carterae.AAC.1